MARHRELLSLVDIADETGISYATLRNYALKYSDEIPSEGSGRNTRYPRPAVKVFQRLRKESKPGRKPASAMQPQAVVTGPVAVPAPAPLPVPVRQEAPQRLLPPVAAVDNHGVEKELAAIRVHLASIAESLKLLVSVPPESSAPPAAALRPAEPAMAAVAAVAAAPAKDQVGAAVPLPVSRDEGGERSGNRRLQSMPKVWGQRGRRPE